MFEQHGVQRSRTAEVPEIEFLQLGRGVNFQYAALLKYNRITKAEKIYSVAGILAMLCCALSFYLISLLNTRAFQASLVFVIVSMYPTSSMELSELE